MAYRKSQPCKKPLVELAVEFKGRRQRGARSFTVPSGIYMSVCRIRYFHFIRVQTSSAGLPSRMRSKRVGFAYFSSGKQMTSCTDGEIMGKREKRAPCIRKYVPLWTDAKQKVMKWRGESTRERGKMADYSCNARERERKKKCKWQNNTWTFQGERKSLESTRVMQNLFSFFFFFFFWGMKEDGRTTENQFNIASYTLQTTHTENEKYLGGVATSYFMLFLWPMRVLNQKNTNLSSSQATREDEEEKEGPRRHSLVTKIRTEQQQYRRYTYFPFFSLSLSLSPKSEECVSLGREW